MRLDDGSADGLEVEHAGIAAQVFSDPSAAAFLNLGVRLGMDGPVVKGALTGRRTGDMPPPTRFAIDHGDVGGDMTPLQQRHPEMAGRVIPLIISRGI